MPGTEHPFRRGGKGGGENVAPQRHRMAGFAAVVKGGRRCNMRHSIYSKDAAERTVPQRQENMGKSCRCGEVGRWAVRVLVKEEKSKRGRKKEGRKEEGRRKKVDRRKEERE